MISFVRGTVASVGATTVVVDVGGIGMELQCTPATLGELRVGHAATLPATLVVREDSMTLYGFADADERSVFDILQTVTGVGPRLAQSLLSVLSPDALRVADALQVRGDAAGQSFPSLPTSCSAAADALLDNRARYEEDGVFPAGLLDAHAAFLRGHHDADLAPRILGDRDAIAALVRRYLHCG